MLKGIRNICKVDFSKTKPWSQTPLDTPGAKKHSSRLAMALGAKLWCKTQATGRVTGGGSPWRDSDTGMKESRD